MSERNSRTLRAGVHADVAALSTMFARAFDANALVAWMLPDPRLRRRVLPAVYALQLRHEHLRRGVVDVVEQDGILLGAACPRTLVMRT